MMESNELEKVLVENKRLWDLMFRIKCLVSALPEVISDGECVDEIADLLNNVDFNAAKFKKWKE